VTRLAEFANWGEAQSHITLTFGAVAVGRATANWTVFVTWPVLL
jgi:hypothetical protein